MSEHLDKAKGALEDARELDPESPVYGDLLVIARVQAELATADALERIADRLDPPKPHRFDDDPPPHLFGGPHGAKA